MNFMWVKKPQRGQYEKLSASPQPDKERMFDWVRAITKGVSSIIEKEFDAAIGHSHSTNQPGGLSQGGETILSRVWSTMVATS
jgi:hypothetical protein